MDLLAEVDPNGAVRATELTHKLAIDGQSDVYRVYRIRLDKLRYNSRNDRIATWVSKYEAEHGGSLPDESDLERFNDAMERLVTKSNEQAVRQTINNIRLFDQRVPAVVLADGLVVDGNRRLTCLRRLAREEPRFGWMEAVILPATIASNRKRLKLIELAIQHGEEGKVDYDPLDRLAGLYKDVVKDGVLTVEEYAQGMGTSSRDVRKMLEQASYVAEFLDFINCPGQFHLVRELDLMGPLQDMPRVMRCCRSEEEEGLVRLLAYANLVVEPARDAAGFVRRFKRILDSSVAQEFMEEEKRLTSKVVERLAREDATAVEVIRNDIRADDELVASFARAMSKADARAKGARVLTTPHENLQRAADYLDRVDTELFAYVPADELRRVNRTLGAIAQRVEEIRDMAHLGDAHGGRA